MRGWPRTARRMRRRVLLAAGVALVATVGCRSVPGPTGDRVLQAGDTMIVVGQRQQLDELEKLAGAKA